MLTLITHLKGKKREKCLCNDIIIKKDLYSDVYYTLKCFELIEINWNGLIIKKQSLYKERSLNWEERE